MSSGWYSSRRKTDPGLSHDRNGLNATRKISWLVALLLSAAGCNEKRARKFHVGAAAASQLYVCSSGIDGMQLIESSRGLFQSKNDRLYQFMCSKAGRLKNCRIHDMQMP